VSERGATLEEEEANCSRDNRTFFFFFSCEGRVRHSLFLFYIFKSPAAFFISFYIPAADCWVLLLLFFVDV
jgi:hypothetical protein